MTNTTYTRDTNTPQMIRRYSDDSPPPIIRQRGARESVIPETISSSENNIPTIRRQVMPQIERQNAFNDGYLVSYESDDEPTGGFN